MGGQVGREIVSRKTFEGQFKERCSGSTARSYNKSREARHNFWNGERALGEEENWDAPTITLRTICACRERGSGLLEKRAG